jgi:hypothetical protein
MEKNKFGLLLMALMCTTALFGQNPIVRNQFTADPTARVFNGKNYVYPSRYILAEMKIPAGNGFVKACNL